MKALFEEMTKDHKEVKEILKKMKGSSEGAVKTREKLYSQLKEELIPHMKAEEKVFYPALMEKKEARKNALEAIEEHGVAETVLRQLGDVPVKDEVWAAKLKVLKELIEHHIEEEEEEIFKIAEKALNKDEIKKVAHSFQEVKEKAKQKSA